MSQHQGPRTLTYPFKPLEKRTLADTWENQGVCSNSQQKSLNIQQTMYHLCDPWSKPMGSQIGSKGKMI